MKTVLVLLGLALSASAQADVLSMPQATSEQTEIDRNALPRRGSSMDSVQAKHGEPLRISGPVGDPPITRWDYGRFIVFFEHQHVINAVVPGKPAPIYHKDELTPRAQ